MPEGLVDMSKQFGSLPMESLIGGPLSAAAKANGQLVATNAQFITDIGFKKDKDGNPVEANMVDFEFEKQIVKPDGSVVPEAVKVKVPMLAIVPLPALKIKDVNVNFTMQVSSSTEDQSSKDSEAGFSGEGGVNYGIFSVHVKVHGKTSSHSSHTRKSDNSAKYDVSVMATDDGIPEGLARVLDMMNDAITPQSSPAKPVGPQGPPS
jgi:hypothetical protein